MNAFRFGCIFMLLCSLLFTATAFSADATTEGSETAYMNAVELLQNRQHADAHAAFSQLLQAQSSNVQYQLGRLAALIELSKEEKERGSSFWKVKGKEAAQIIKQMYRIHISTPGYYLTSARYYTLIERERELDNVIKKALYFRADISEVNITKGDSYFWLAKLTDPHTVKELAPVISVAPHVYVRHDKGMVAKGAYDDALKSSVLAKPRQTYVYFMLAELERTIFLNKEQAAVFRKKAVEVDPNSYWGKKAAEVLRTGSD